MLLADLRRHDVDMNWKFFIGASILSAGLLIKVGAPCSGGLASRWRRSSIAGVSVRDREALSRS